MGSPSSRWRSAGQREACDGYEGSPSLTPADVLTVVLLGTVALLLGVLAWRFRRGSEPELIQQQLIELRVRLDALGTAQHELPRLLAENRMDQQRVLADQVAQFSGLVSQRIETAHATVGSRRSSNTRARLPRPRPPPPVSRWSRWRALRGHCPRFQFQPASAGILPARRSPSRVAPGGTGSSTWPAFGSHRSTGRDFIDAVKRGHIVHDVLERLEEDADLEWLLEDAIGRWDETAPPPEGSEGVEYRAHLREEVESVAHHPAYRAVADLPTARRELGFLRIEDDGAIYQGRVDLAGSEGDRLVLLDVKTTQCTAAAVAACASQYAPQRDVYVSSVGGISGLEVDRFSFQFSRAGSQIATTISDEIRTQAAESLDAMRSAVARGEAPLTQHPAECRFCGYKRVGWCPGVHDERGEGRETSQGL